MIAYRIEVTDAHAHQFRVTLRVARPARGQRLTLPVWIPGSYMVREFARHLSRLEAWQGRRPVLLHQLDKTCWQADTQGAGTLVVRYLVYAFDTSVRTAYLDAQRGFFNGTSVFLRVEGRESEPHRLELGGLPRGWQVATAMNHVRMGAAGVGRYEAADYDELVDHPVELGHFWRGEFTAGGVAHEFIVSGALPGLDGARLLADTQAICEAQIALWHGRGGRRAARPPFERYVFLLNAAADGYGGLEHRASTALICARRDLPRIGQADGGDAYVTLLGLISHEYFHTWNVKRLKPAELERIDYGRENYTGLLWFFEGFTSYYDDLMLLRSRRIDASRYLGLVGKTISGVLATPGRAVQSLAQSSFDAWVKYYRTDENTPNATVSYYTKGSLVALALDLTLRSEGRGTLDAVMQHLWRTSGGGPIDEAAIAAALQHVAARSFAGELAAWVHGTDDLPLRPLFERLAVDWSEPVGTPAQRAGLRLTESALTGVQVKSVLRGSAAERAGLAAGDELLAADGWRLRRFDEIAAWTQAQAPVALLVSRDQRVFTSTLQIPAALPGAGGVTLALAERASAAALALRRAWLGR